jgi:hypothetical protein
MTQPATQRSLLLSPVLEQEPVTTAPSLQETRRLVRRALRPAFLFSDPATPATLHAYAFACGQDVAAWHLAHLGEFLSGEQVDSDGAALARHTLVFQATHTDDPAAFCRLYHAAFCAGYHAYQAATKGAAMPCERAEIPPIGRSA